MAITAVTVKRSHVYRFSTEDGQPLPSQDLERRFYVYSDTNDENPDTVRTATGIPAWGDTHPTITSALALDFDVERDEEYPKRWEVRVRYASRRLKGGGDGTFDQDPSLITRIRVSTVSGERLIDRDIDDAPIATTAGELISGVKIPWNELQMEFTQYRSVLDTAAYLQLAQYRNAINSDTWRGFDEYTARIHSIEGQAVDINGVTYLERKIVVLLRDPSDPQQPNWKLRLLNAGYYYKSETEIIRTEFYSPDLVDYEVKLKRLYDPDTGQYTTRPLALSASGETLGDPDNPVWIDFDVYPELPFSALDI